MTEVQAIPPGFGAVLPYLVIKMRQPHSIFIKRPLALKPHYE